MKYAQFVLGPAGSGKSTYCAHIAQFYENNDRSAFLFNMDPAAEVTAYRPDIDIRELLDVSTIEKELDTGPNGGLVFAMQLLFDNQTWLNDSLGNSEEDFLIVDCPGQIELYTHLNIMKDIISVFQSLNYRICVCYLLDASFCVDISKFMAGCMSSLATMINLELPHINIISKADMWSTWKMKEENTGIMGIDQDENEMNESDEDENGISKGLEEFLDVDVDLLINKLQKATPGVFDTLNEAIGNLLRDYNLLSFIPVSVYVQSSMEAASLAVDTTLQFGEDEEPKFRDYDDS